LCPPACAEVDNVRGPASEHRQQQFATSDQGKKDPHPNEDTFRELLIQRYTPCNNENVPQDKATLPHRNRCRVFAPCGLSVWRPAVTPTQADKMQDLAIAMNVAPLYVRTYVRLNRAPGGLPLDALAPCALLQYNCNIALYVRGRTTLPFDDLQVANSDGSLT